MTNIDNLTCITGDSGGLIAAILVVGFMQGPLIPAVSAFAAPWFMTEERGRIVSIVFMGINVGKSPTKFQIIKWREIRTKI